MTNTDALQFREENSCRKYSTGEGITAVPLLRMEGVLHHTAADTVWPERGPSGGVRQGSVFSLDEVLECVVEFPLHSLCNIIFSFAIASAKSPISLSQKALPRS